MSRAASPFSPRVVLGLIAVGAAAFLLFLYALGAGWTGGDRAMGSGHAASKGLNGYAALVDLLGRRGYDVSLSRTPGRLDEEALLVLTPPHFTDADELDALIEERRWEGPTILVLPKWFGVDPSLMGLEEARRGWVVVGEAESPQWSDELALGELDSRIGKADAWYALGRSGKLAAPDETLSIFDRDLVRLIGDGKGRSLAAFRVDGSPFEALFEFAEEQRIRTSAEGRDAQRAITVTPVDALPAEIRDDPETTIDDDYQIWPLVIVAEPDLFNNAGLADAERARLAMQLIDATLDGSDLPIVFDLTLPGLGQSENLLTLAFEPPFLAATLTLLLVALVIGWRAFARFGPPLAEAPPLAGGKAQLARNGAALIARARRMRLVGPPYAALVAARVARALGLPERIDAETREAMIARALERRGEDPAAFAAAAETLRRAKKSADLLRAARALKTIERTFSQ